MKKYIFTLLLMVNFSSCQSQNNLKIDYKAQTRGYALFIALENEKLSITENSLQKEVILTKNQLKELTNELNKIDFTTLALQPDNELYKVDRAIPASLFINVNGEKYNFEFSHNNHPEIEKIISILKGYTPLK